MSTVRLVAGGVFVMFGLAGCVSLEPRSADISSGNNRKDGAIENYNKLIEPMKDTKASIKEVKEKDELLYAATSCEESAKEAAEANTDYTSEPGGALTKKEKVYVFKKNEKFETGNGPKTLASIRSQCHDWAAKIKAIKVSGCEIAVINMTRYEGEDQSSIYSYGSGVRVPITSQKQLMFHSAKCDVMKKSDKVPSSYKDELPKLTKYCANGKLLQDSEDWSWEVDKNVYPNRRYKYGTVGCWRTVKR